MSTLESRYRLLLACYPGAHRREYEDEMLGVLLAAARPDQRWPSPAEMVGIFASAGRMRWAHRTGLVCDDDGRRVAPVLAASPGATVLTVAALNRQFERSGQAAEQRRVAQSG